MFRTSFLFLYLLPNFYVYFRLKRLFPSSGYKRVFTLVYIFLALAFPITERLSHNADFFGRKYFLIIGYYSLPYLLYLFLVVLSLDLLLGLNLLFKAVSKETIRGRLFRSFHLLILLAVPLAVVILGSLNYNHITINECRIEIPQKSSAITHLKVALVADFHLRELTSKRFMPGFVAKVNSLSPDLVVIPGDVLEGDRRDEGTAEFENQFRQIRAKYGVYASLGNHESYGGTGKLNFFRNANIHLLQDMMVLIDNSFYLAGRNDLHFGSRKTLPDLLKEATENLPILLLDHRPSDLEEVSRSAVDVQFSGHTHNGQLFPLAKREYELSWGHKKKGNTYFFVTCGIQGWGPPVKTAGVSEIMLINIEFVKDIERTLGQGALLDDSFHDVGKGVDFPH
jgi:predicted MPP superfamily phosphohydrolase